MTPEEFEARFVASITKMSPAVMKANLVRAGLFLAAWEMLKSEIQDQVRGFYAIGWGIKGEKVDETEYREHVRSKHKDRFEASILWLIEGGALTTEQAERVRAIRDHRNQVAHELPKLLLSPDDHLNVDLLRELRDLIGVLGRFWGRVNVDTNPDFDGVEVDDNEIKSGTMMVLEMMIEAAGEAKP